MATSETRERFRPPLLANALAELRAAVEHEYQRRHGYAVALEVRERERRGEWASCTEKVRAQRIALSRRQLERELRAQCRALVFARFLGGQSGDDWAYLVELMAALGDDHRNGNGGPTT